MDRPRPLVLSSLGVDRRISLGREPLRPGEATNDAFHLDANSSTHARASEGRLCAEGHPTKAGLDTFSVGLGEPLDALEGVLRDLLVLEALDRVRWALPSARTGSRTS